jgi:molybdenum cofactor biosynthesis enzyme MoaA
MCNHWRDESEYHLDVNFFKSLVGALAGIGCKKIHLTGGEATLRPNLEELIAYIRDRKIRVTMTTNATRIDLKRAKSLAKVGLRKVNISIDVLRDFRPETYNNHPCFAPWTHALIDRVGRVSVCCMMPNKPIIGDLRQQSIDFRF